MFKGFAIELVRPGIPKAHVLVPAAGDNASAIRTECGACDTGGMNHWRRNRLAGARLPHTDLSVLAGGDDSFTVWIKSRIGYRLRMHDLHWATIQIVRVPDRNNPAFCGGNNPRSVGTEPGRHHTVSVFQSRPNLFPGGHFPDLNSLIQ